MPLSASLRPIPASALTPDSSNRVFLTTQLGEFDVLLQGIPRGAITEIVGGPSSGRTTFVNRFLSAATRLGEYCCIVDSTKAYTPETSKAAGIDVRRLLWVQCDGLTDKSRVEQAIKCTDLLIHAGGWGVIVLDLCDIQQQWVRRLPTSYWYRFRRAVEHTPTALIVLEREANVKTCAALALEMNPGQPLWSGRHPDFRILSTVGYASVPRKPVRQEQPSFIARAIAS